MLIYDNCQWGSIFLQNYCCKTFILSALNVPFEYKSNDTIESITFNIEYWLFQTKDKNIHVCVARTLMLLESEDKTEIFQYLKDGAELGSGVAAFMFWQQKYDKMVNTNKDLEKSKWTLLLTVRQLNCKMIFMLKYISFKKNEKNCKWSEWKSHELDFELMIYYLFSKVLKRMHTFLFIIFLWWFLSILILIHR